MSELRILITGGGTGGHVSPALAVVQTLQKRADAASPSLALPRLIFRYVGSAEGVEATLAREAGLEFVGVASGKLRRSSRGPLGLLTGANLRDAFRIPVGILQAMGAVRAFRPQVVLATGGYVSVPPVIAAARYGVPILTHEQTVTVGLANKIAGRFATRIALTFEGAMDDLPTALRAKAFVTGNPVRAAIFAGDGVSALHRFFPDAAPGADRGLPCVYVTGGAQGSRILNRAVLAALPDLLVGCRIIHQCGQQPEGMEQDFDALSDAARALPQALRHRYFVTRFVRADEIGDVYALADLLIARSGAGTVTEACALGKPALFVPLVPTGGDEQTRNAQRSVDAGGAVILPQSRCDAAHLLAETQALLGDPARRRAMGEAARTLARPHAADALADALLALAAAAS
ncbi:MAG: UDP-N-acetylglucosamine--N-acetylmuramyl-(pentapeptide) pyrophosphoryl-undecaprenol N-acetylglucosamine transferase [Cytophagales bacterium]|nr:UDP-N-acetylglucosamine--N-acetylmuramyl-(pentapeptide) pyrophosphoryl-undecaprenol N-acetylglucosamine transferase [Armatimonadota bacterium]